MRITHVQLDVVERGQHAAQVVLERAIELHHVQKPRPRRQPLGEHAGAAADLQHDVIVGELREPLDHVQDVAVDQKVLTELSPPEHRRPAAAASTSRLKS